MVLEKKTSRGILEHQEVSAKALAEYDKKVWVSSVSLRLWLNRMRSLGHDEGVIKALLTELNDNDYQ